MLYSTLRGGSCYDRPTDIAVTPAGAVFVTGETNSIDFPLVRPQTGAPAIQNYESFVSMISANGASLTYSSYLLAGSAPTLALGPDGILHIAGDVGFDAQTMTYGGFPLPPPNPSGPPACSTTSPTAGRSRSTTSATRPATPPSATRSATPSSSRVITSQVASAAVPSLPLGRPPSSLCISRR